MKFKKINTLFIVFFISSSSFAKELISITAVGDIMMGTTYPENSLPQNDGKNMFEEAVPWIKASDVRLGNFEGTFFDGDPQPDGKMGGPNRWLFRTPPSYASHLVDAGFNVMGLANNHIRDFGSAGIASTKETLKANNIKYSSKSGEVAVFEVEETPVAVIAVDYYPGKRSIVDSVSTMNEIKLLKEKNYIVIVTAHAGGEGKEASVIPEGMEIFLNEKRGDSVHFAHQAIEAGADLIIMHGPHVPRALEVYNNRLIAYSLGNFMTGKGISILGKAGEAPLLRVQVDREGKFVQGQIVSFVQQRYPQKVVLDKSHKAFKTIVELSSLQFPQSPLVFENNGLFK